MLIRSVQILVMVLGVFLFIVACGGKLIVLPLGTVEKSFQFTYEIEKRKGEVSLVIKGMGYTDQVKVDVYTKLFRNDQVFHEERLFVQRLDADDHVRILVPNGHAADQIYIRYREGSRRFFPMLFRDAVDEHFGSFMIDMR